MDSADGEVGISLEEVPDAKLRIAYNHALKASRRIDRAAKRLELERDWPENDENHIESMFQAAIHYLDEISCELRGEIERRKEAGEWYSDKD